MARTPEMTQPKKSLADRVREIGAHLQNVGLIETPGQLRAIASDLELLAAKIRDESPLQGFAGPATTGQASRLGAIADELAVKP